jgi:T-complex protein 1 subunit theta
MLDCVSTVFRQEDAGSTAVATILLRASTNNILNDIERAVDDGVNTVRMMGRDGRFLAGAGAVEIELARRLEEFGNKTAGLEQYAIKKFGEALEVWLCVRVGKREGTLGRG